MPKLTPSGKKTAVADVEQKLKKQYPPGTLDREHKIYGTLNKAELMHGNKTTAKGKKAAKKK